MSAPIELVILGSTGSIGVQALEIVEANPSLFRVVAITAAGSNTELLISQAKKFNVPVIGVTKNADQIKAALPNSTVIDGPLASTEIAAITCDVDLIGATFLEKNSDLAANTKHSTAKQAAQIAKMANVKQLMLGHFSNRYPNKEDFITEASDTFQNVILAEDLKTFNI
mgnify:CR=1 FL=1